MSKHAQKITFSFDGITKTKKIFPQINFYLKLIAFYIITKQTIVLYKVTNPEQYLYGLLMLYLKKCQCIRPST